MINVKQRLVEIKVKNNNNACRFKKYIRSECVLLSAKSVTDSSLDYHQDTDIQLFKNESGRRLLKSLPENNVILMDVAGY